MNKRLIIPLLFFLSFFITSAHAVVLTINATDDTYAYSGSPTTNYSTSTTWIPYTQPLGYTEVFFKFNISSIPANSTIYNAYITTYAIYARTGTGRNIEVYNTTNAWTEYNLTWANKPALGTLLSNTTGVDYTATGRKNFTVTAGVNSAYWQGTNILSLVLRDNVINGTAAYQDFASKEYPTVAYREQLVVNYTLTDCIVSCGDCGCNAAHDGCYVPPIVGSYCAIEDGLPNTIKTVSAACSDTKYFNCPTGTACSQVTPYFNSTTYPTTPGASANCDGCWFINLLTGWPPHWKNVRTNCPADPECNCYGPICSGNVYQAENISDTPYTITEWTAGCFNPITGNWTPLINSTGYNTTLTKLVNDTCGNECTLTNNTPGITTCPVNTTTVCHDANCLPVTCSGTPPSTTCSSNSGGQLALALGSVMGITDCSLAQGLLAIVASISVGFALLYYMRDSEHNGQAFIFGTLIVLVMFTFVSWFPSWLMLILIVLGGYLVAKSMGFGGS